MHHFALQASSFEFEDRGPDADIDCRICESARDRRFALFVRTDRGFLGPIGSSCLFEKVLPCANRRSQVLARRLDNIAREMTLRAQQREQRSRPPGLKLSEVRLPRAQRGWPLPTDEAEQVKQLLHCAQLGLPVRERLERLLEFGYSRPAQRQEIAYLYRNHLVPGYAVKGIEAYAAPTEPAQPLISRRFREHLAAHIPDRWQVRCAQLDAIREVAPGPGDEEAYAVLDLASSICGQRLPTAESGAYTRRSRQLAMIATVPESCLTLPTTAWKDYLTAHLQRAPLTEQVEAVTGLNRPWRSVLAGHPRSAWKRAFDSQLEWQRALAGKPAPPVSLMAPTVLMPEDQSFLLEHLRETDQIHALAEQYLRTRF